MTGENEIIMSTVLSIYHILRQVERMYFPFARASWCAAAASMAALSVATVGGNAGVLTSLWTARRTPTHYPLASLAVADLLVGACVLPVAAARELFTFKLNWLLCACWSTLDVLCCTASILSLCALGWERYSGITAPLSRAYRAKWAKILAALVWPVATAVALPTAFVKSPELRKGGVEKTCPVNTNASYVFFSVTFSFYLPTCVMLVLYAQILKALSSAPSIRRHRGQAPIQESSQTRATTPEPDKSIHPVDVTAAKILNVASASEECPVPLQIPNPLDGSDNRQRRATVTIIRLMLLFLICWTPFFIMLPIDSLCECVWESTSQWCTWLGYANSALNPVVYAAAAPGVTRALHAIFKLLLMGEILSFTWQPISKKKIIATLIVLNAVAVKRCITAMCFFGVSKTFIVSLKIRKIGSRGVFIWYSQQQKY